MATSYGAASNFKARFSGPYGGGGGVEKIVSITLPVDTWKGAISPYTQKLKVEGVSVNSILDLAGEAEALDILTESRCVIYLRNDNGEVTAVAAGGKPKSTLTLQATIREGVIV